MLGFTCEVDGNDSKEETYQTSAGASKEFFIPAQTLCHWSDSHAGRPGSPSWILGGDGWRMPAQGLAQLPRRLLHLVHDLAHLLFGDLLYRTRQAEGRHDPPAASKDGSGDAPHSRSVLFVVDGHAGLANPPEFLPQTWQGSNSPGSEARQTSRLEQALRFLLWEKSSQRLAD